MKEERSGGSVSRVSTACPMWQAGSAVPLPFPIEVKALTSAAPQQPRECNAGPEVITKCQCIFSVSLRPLSPLQSRPHEIEGDLPKVCGFLCVSSKVSPPFVEWKLVWERAIFVTSQEPSSRQNSPNQQNNPDEHCFCRFSVAAGERSNQGTRHRSGFNCQSHGWVNLHASSMSDD